jgi:hypothetical protein
MNLWGSRGRLSIRALHMAAIRIAPMCYGANHIHHNLPAKISQSIFDESGQSCQLYTKLGHNVHEYGHSIFVELPQKSGDLIFMMYC